MATSAIKEAYLKRLTDFEFPSAPPEPVSSQTAGAGRGSYAGFNPAEDARAKEPQASMTEYDATARQRLSAFLQRGFEGMGMERSQARANAQTLIGGESSNLPLTMGIADVIPFLGTGLQTQEAYRMGKESAQSVEQGNYGTAALQAGGSVLGLLPGAMGTIKVGKEVIGGIGKQLDRAIMEGTGPLAGVVPDALKPMYAVEPGAAMTPSVTAIQLTKGENSLVTASAKRNLKLRESATQAVKDLHGNYPEADGWASIEAKTIKFKNAKSGSQLVDVEAKKIPYAFHTPPTGVPKDQWRDQMSAKVVGEVQAVVDRAAAGDESAIAIIKQASWYRSMRDRLRTEFGAIGDVFADVLGTTSAQTGVEQNFNNAVEVLRRFSRGDYDKELAAFERRVAAGEPIDGGTLTKLHKSGEFPLITKAGGQLFNANSPSSMGALLDMFRAVKASDSPKTPNFTGNLIGLTNEATIDVWAARMLRRVSDLPRIPPPAEKGVAGKHLVGSSLYEPKVGSEFGFGQEVFKDAAQQINASGMVKSVDPEIGDLGPDDLQAVAWFIEKEKWTNNGWTTKAGEGGSLDYEMAFAGAPDQEAVRVLRREINAGFKAPPQRKTETDADYTVRVQQLQDLFDQNKTSKQQELSQMEANVERYTLGVSGERPGQPMSNYGQAELAAELDDVVRNDQSVVTYNLANTYGSFMADTERALNAEFVTRQDFDPAPLERRLVEQGKAYDQDAVFISKVVPDGASPNARPGVEIYFKQKMTPNQMAAVTAKLRQYGVDGFTYATDMRFGDKVNVQARAGGAETAGLNGVRFQYIPEFDDAYNPANKAAMMQEKQDLFDQIVTDIIGEGNVSDARLVWYDTKVHFRSDYDVYLGRNVGQAGATPGAKPPVGANAAQSDNSAKVGKESSRAVSNRLSKKTAGAAPAKVGANPRAKGLLDGY